jgi:toxin-antitoxin system, antitoxin component, xre family
VNKGAKIKERRKFLRLTLKEVAAAVGVAEATVQRWESGNIESIRADRITKLSNVLQLPVEEVTGWFSKEEEWKKLDSEANLEQICSEVELAKCIEEVYGTDALHTFSKFLELNEKERNKITELLFSYSTLDEIDRAEVRGNIKGIIDTLLSDPKYSIQKESSGGKAI